MKFEYSCGSCFCDSCDIQSEMTEKNLPHYSDNILCLQHYYQIDKANPEGKQKFFPMEVQHWISNKSLNNSK